jgi:hypothetical protein
MIAMSSTQKFGLGLLASFFTLCLFGVATMTALNRVFGTPATLKSSLASSGAYDTFATAIAKQAAQDGQDPGNDVQLDNAAVQGVLNKVITPGKLQGYAEQVIDGTYGWLEGDTPTPNYRVDLSGLKQELGVAVSDSAVQRLSGLPVCTSAQLRQLNGQNNDPFTLPCRPPGLNLTAERQRLVSEITQSPDILEDTTLTADDTKSESGQTPFEKLGMLPTIFQWSRVAPWLLGAIALASSVGIVHLNDNKQTGRKMVAKSLLTTGLLLLVSVGVSTFLIGKLKTDGQAADSQYLQEAMVSLVRSLAGAFNRVMLVFAVTYALLGAGGFMYLKHRGSAGSSGISKPPLPRPPKGSPTKPR